MLHQAREHKMSHPPPPNSNYHSQCGETTKPLATDAPERAATNAVGSLIFSQYYPISYIVASQIVEIDILGGGGLSSAWVWGCFVGIRRKMKSLLDFL